MFKFVVRHLTGSVARNFSWLIALRILQQSLSLLGIFYLARGLSKESLGLYGVLLSIISICSIFTVPGLNNAAAQGAARGNFGIYRHAVALSFKGSILGSIFCLIAVLIFDMEQPGFATALIFVSAIFPFSHGLKQWESVLTGTEKFKTIFLLGSLASIITYGTMILGVLNFPDQILVPVLAIVVVPAAINLTLTVYFLERVKNQHTEQDAVTYGIRSSLYLAINTIANHLDKFLIFYFLSPAFVAIFIVAEKFAELAKNCIQDFTAILMPLFARSPSYTSRLDNFLKVIGMVFSILLIIFSFVALPWLIVVVFSEQYANAIPYAQGLMISVAIGIHASLGARYITAKLDGVSVRDIYLSISLTRIFLTCVLVPFFGLWGAVLSAILYRLISTVIVRYIIGRRYAVKS